MLKQQLDDGVVFLGLALMVSSIKCGACGRLGSGYARVTKSWQASEVFLFVDELKLKFVCGTATCELMRCWVHA